MISREMQALRLLEAFVRAAAPYDTGNLALNSIRILGEGDSYYLAVGGEIAPYAIFTNIKWRRGQNPNEGWLETTIKEAISHIKSLLSGTMTTVEYNLIMQRQGDIVKQTQADRITAIEQGRA